VSVPDLEAGRAELNSLAWGRRREGLTPGTCPICLSCSRRDDVDGRGCSPLILIRHVRVTIKTRLRDLLAAGDFERVTEIAADKRRALAILVALTYDRDPEIAWRAVEALGTAAARVAEDDPNYVREQLRRLYWLISEESGAICWHAPEAMAEIVRNRPRLFADYIPIVVFLILSMAKEDLDHFKTGTLWAIGRLGSFAADHFDEVRGAVTDALDDPDPQVRGTAVWCLGRLGQTAILAERSYLLSDEAPVVLYENLTIQQTSVSELVRRMLAEIRE
jgi:hypothetical protein